MKQEKFLGVTIAGFILLIAAGLGGFYHLEQKIQQMHRAHTAETAKLQSSLNKIDSDFSKKLQSQQKQLKIPNNLTVIWNKLDPIVASIELLPFKTRLNNFKQQSQQKTSDSTWQERAKSTWQQLKNLVKIEKSTNKDNPRMHNLRQLYGREQLRLSLEQIRLGAMYNNFEIYQSAINSAISLMQQNFNTSNNRVKSNIAQLQQLLEVPLSVY